MSSCQGKSSTKTDIGWNHFHQKIDNQTVLVCNYCGHQSSGGIFRAKQHLVGVDTDYKGVKKCPKCPQSVRDEVLAAMNKKSKKKQMNAGRGEYDACFYEVDDDEVGESNPQRKRTCPTPTVGASGSKKGTMDQFILRKPYDAHAPKMRQRSIMDCVNPKLRERACQEIGHFFYDGALAFNLAKLESFKRMIQAVGEAGPNMKPPSYHELRVPVLKKAVAIIEDRLKENVEETEKYGCSLMADGWEDKRHRTLINFLANNSKGSMFLDSVDASNKVKDGKLICELLEKYVDKVGEKNVIQVITDNGSNYKLAGKLLMERRPNLFWTPCAAHCIDLMLEDIGKISVVRNTISKAITFVGFIYRHVSVLHIMWEHTNKRELAKYGTTRFATTFLTLKSLHKHQSELKRMFLSPMWKDNRWSKDASGIEANRTVFAPSFWNNVVYILKLMGPLVVVLRTADNEMRPSMGYIYEAMDRAKEAILKSFETNKKKCEEVLKIIDNRWDNQLHHPLHAAGYYLNPYFYYHNPRVEADEEVTSGFLKCVKRLVPNNEAQSKILMSELSKYQTSGGLFGNQFAIDARNDPKHEMSPADWWRTFGNSTPNLKELAIKILSLTTSSSGCERNWSIFELIHSKRRTKLEHKRLRDLVYVKYNRKLKDRVKSKKNDPILLNLEDIDDINNEWTLGRMESLDIQDAGDLPVHDDGSDLTWNVVAEASGVNERRHTRSTSKGNFQLVDESEGEFDDGDETEEDEEEVEIGKDSDEEEEGDEGWETWDESNGNEGLDLDD